MESGFIEFEPSRLPYQAIGAFDRVGGPRLAYKLSLGGIEAPLPVGAPEGAEKTTSA